MNRIKASLIRFALAGAVLLAPIGALGLQADEGSIPIYKQTTITAPGHYVVTRDFSFASGNGITIQADNVTLDLNGHTITGPACTGGSETVVMIENFVAARGIVIRNGRLLSGCYGINDAHSSGNRMSVRIERVEVGDSGKSGISMDAKFVEILHCHVHDVGKYGMLITGNGGAFAGRISDNTVEHVPQSGISLDGLAAGEVRRNVVTDYGSFGAGYSGITLLADAVAWGAGGNLVEGNTVTALPGGTDDDGIGVGATSPYNLILNNVVKGCRLGIYTQADGTRIEKNVVSNNSLHGIQIGWGITGSFNHLEENQAQGNTGAGSCGINFTNGNGHVFRNNNLRNNTASGAACGVGSGTNTDGGGNIQ